MRALQRIVEGFGAPYGFERSVKIVDGALLADRCLMSLHRDALGRDPTKALAEAMAPPVDVSAALEGADIVHFGHEAEPGFCVRKLYFEYATRARAAMAASEATLVHVAYKWRLAEATPHPNPLPQGERGPQAGVGVRHGNVGAELNAPCKSGPSPLAGEGGRRPDEGDALPSPAAAPSSDTAAIVTRYVWRPDATRARIEARVPGPRGRAAALALLERAGRENVAMLDVEEPGGPRVSLDINVYDAGLTLDAVAGVINDAAAAFGIAREAVAEVFAPARDQALGHLAAGLDRRGREFVTFYFGVEERRP